MVFAQKGFPINTVNLELCCSSDLCAKSWASIPCMALHHFLSLKPLVPLKEKFGFLRAIKKTSQLAPANNPPSSC